MRRMIVFLTAALLLNSLEAASQLNLTKGKDSLSKKLSIKVLPQNFYTKNLGYFCKKEVQLQKATRLPLFLRLGSKDYVDYLERKPNALSPVFFRSNF